jgi:MFS transporter, FSR family, fosmidomycin resistance protein
METAENITRAGEEDFQAADVTIVSGGHFMHDVFTAFLSPLLPEIIRVLQISLAQAGSLSAFMQIPSLLNPLIGYLDDRRNLKLGLILAPGITATLLSSIGLAPNYASLAILLLLAGFSIALFHALAPSRLARISGKNVGRAMSFFMAGGELGRTLGPLVAVWAVSTWTLPGILPLAVAGWFTSFLLWQRFGRLETDTRQARNGGKWLPGAARFFIPVTIFIMLRGAMISSLGIYLPTLLAGEGANLWTAGSALALYQLAGSAGALFGGTLSDRFGRRAVLAVTSGGAGLLFLTYLFSPVWITTWILLFIGFLNLTMQPVMLALVQDVYPENRSLANGIYMALNFLSFSLNAVLVGAAGDWIGLRGAFFWTAVLAIAALPFLAVIPSESSLAK